jgi:flagellar hook assembly protein FlgD
MVLSYGHVVTLHYNLGTDADVTVTVESPDGAQKILLSESQSAGDQEVIWDGTDENGALFATPGHYTFTVTATMPESGASVSRRGNITVRK